MLASLTKALSTAKKEPVRNHHPSVVNSRPRAPLSPNTRINTIDHATTNDDGGGISTPVRNLSSALNSVEDSVSKVLSGSKPFQIRLSTKSKLLARLLGQGESSKEGSEQGLAESNKEKWRREWSFEFWLSRCCQSFIPGCHQSKRW